MIDKELIEQLAKEHGFEFHVGNYGRVMELKQDVFIGNYEALEAFAKAYQASIAAQKQEPVASRNTHDILCERKTQSIIDDGYSHNGYVLKRKEEWCVINGSAVRWLTNIEMWELMHPSNTTALEARVKELEALHMAIRESIIRIIDGNYVVPQEVHGEIYCIKNITGEALTLKAGDIQQAEGNQELIDAAKAVVERWDTPLWKDVPHTAEYIHRLRNALAAHNKAKEQ